MAILCVECRVMKCNPHPLPCSHLTYTHSSLTPTQNKKRRFLSPQANFLVYSNLCSGILQPYVKERSFQSRFSHSDLLGEVKSIVWSLSKKNDRVQNPKMCTSIKNLKEYCIQDSRITLKTTVKTVFQAIGKTVDNAVTM